MAILTTPAFDATSVDPTTVTFEGAAPVQWALEDVDGDADTDMILHFRTQETGIEPGQAVACLQGMTFDGGAFSGCDTIRIVPPKSDLDGDSSGFGNPPVFGDDVEGSLGTNPLDNCAGLGAANAWPPDVNDDGRVSMEDALTFLRPFGQELGDPFYRARLDLVFDGRIGLADVLTMVPFMNSTCTVPPLDTDGDGIVDTKDIDDDNDGFTDTMELYLGTSHLSGCPTDSGDDAWPPDFNRDGIVDTADVQLLTDALDISLQIIPGNIRYDLSADGVISTLDLSLIQTYIGSHCS